MTELPRIISVDDHVIEPAHLFETWLPEKYRDRGPKPLTAGIGELAYVGGKYQITMDPDGPPTDWWIYEDLKFPYKRNIAAVGFDRDEMTLEGITREEMQDLIITLKSGALPATLTYLEERTVGPSLGQDSIRAGVTASIGGLALVVLFMVFYYKLTGLNAVLSIVVNLLILLGLMAYFQATMTLPGIAGFILTIGMGVDSNVLIFERIKEELAAGKGARAAVSGGFDRVWWTIVDTHVASLISAGFLFQFGTGPIRGFATTLFFGLLANVFTAVFVSRTLFELILSRKPATAAATISV